MSLTSTALGSATTSITRVFIVLGERLEQLRDQHEQGILNSLSFLKALLEIAKEVVEAEKQVVPEDE